MAVLHNTEYLDIRNECYFLNETNKWINEWEQAEFLIVSEALIMNLLPTEFHLDRQLRIYYVRKVGGSI